MKKKNIKGYLERMPPVDWKRLLIRLLPYAVIAYISNRLAWLYSCCTGQTAFVKLYVLLSNIPLAFSSLLPSFDIIHVLTSISCSCLVYGIVAYRRMNAKKFRTGSEYGSARWGTKKDIAPFVDQNPENNVILTATESLTMASRGGPPKYMRNKNIMVVGGSGSGKTRFFVKPNLMQMHSSYCVTDPKGYNAIRT